MKRYELLTVTEQDIGNKIVFKERVYKRYFFKSFALEDAIMLGKNPTVTHSAVRDRWSKSYNGCTIVK